MPDAAPATAAGNAATPATDAAATDAAATDAAATDAAPVTDLDSLEAFVVFCTQLRDAGVACTPEQAVERWKRAKVQIEEVREAIAQVDRGEGRPAHEFVAEMRSRVAGTR